MNSFLTNGHDNERILSHTALHAREKQMRGKYLLRSEIVVPEFLQVSRQQTEKPDQTTWYLNQRTLRTH
jgi:hypothetical protein